MLAVAFLDVLRANPLTLPSVKRYVTSDLLFSYCIRSTDKITDMDRNKALEIANNAIKGKPTSFRTAPPGSPIAKERRLHILSGLADPR